MSLGAWEFLHVGVMDFVPERFEVDASGDTSADGDVEEIDDGVGPFGEIFVESCVDKFFVLFDDKRHSHGDILWPLRF